MSTDMYIDIYIYNIGNIYYTYIHTHIHTYMHICIHKGTYIYIHTQWVFEGYPDDPSGYERRPVLSYRAERRHGLESAWLPRSLDFVSFVRGTNFFTYTNINI